MLTGKFRRIFHYHLKKCGGSTLNQWLDTLTFDERTFNSNVKKTPSERGMTTDDHGETSELGVPARPNVLFHWSDVVHDHAPMRIFVPDNTFCFTVLRDPVQRLLSQISDWRRLNDADTVNSPPELRECVSDSRRMPLGDFLEKHAQREGRRHLDNYLTRALAASRIGDWIEDAMDPDRMCAAALYTLERDYDLIGLTEQLDLTRNALCAIVGLPPARKIPKINATRLSRHFDPELRGLGDLVKNLTRVDRIIYDRARQIFDRRHRQAAASYDTAAFEAHYADRLLAEARGITFDGTTRFSVKAPIVGSGFHGRDGSGMDACAVWSGPETRMTLYMPTPANMSLTILVWIRGYVVAEQREQLRVRVDGQSIAHRFDYADDYADVLAIDTVSTREFVRLEIDLDETLESGEPGTEYHDKRERGFAFDSYGWRPA